MTRSSLPACLCAIALALGLGACGSMRSSRGTLESTKFTVANTERFTIADPSLGGQVQCTGLREKSTADGRLAVIANVRNAGASPLRLEVGCDFLDANGMVVLEKPWQPLVIGAGSTEVVSFTGPAAEGQRYSIRVRRAP